MAVKTPLGTIIVIKKILPAAFKLHFCSAIFPEYSAELFGCLDSTVRKRGLGSPFVLGEHLSLLVIDHHSLFNRHQHSPYGNPNRHISHINIVVRNSVPPLAVLFLLKRYE